jgi:hypothetical protein
MFVSLKQPFLELIPEIATLGSLNATICKKKGGGTTRTNNNNKTVKRTKKSY